MKKAGLNIGLVLSGALLVSLFSACESGEVSSESRDYDATGEPGAPQNVPPGSPAPAAPQNEAPGGGGGEELVRYSLPTLSAGGWHSCALLNDGGVKCWGSATNIQQQDIMHSPTLVEGVSDAVQITAGSKKSCALTAVGNVACWNHGQRAAYVMKAAGTSDRLANIVQVDSGMFGNSICALTTEGGIKCWGDDIVIANKKHSTPQELLGKDGNALLGATQVAVGGEGNFACILTSSGGVKCWSKTSAFPEAVVSKKDSSPITGIVQISAGYEHACVLTSLDAGGKVMCWGRGHDGTLGNGSTDDENSAVGVVTEDGSALDGIVSVAAGGQHTCAVDEDGDAWCWGSSSSCVVLTGAGCQDTAKAHNIVKGEYTTGFSSITAGGRHACGLVKSNSSDTSAYCWGSNAEGQIATKTATLWGDKYRPSQVTDLVVPHRRAELVCTSSACSIEKSSN